MTLRPNKTAYSHDSAASRHPADDYPTPRGFIIPLLDHLQLDPGTEVWDPCAGGGHLAAVLRERFHRVRANDLYYTGDDFLDDRPKHTDGWIITNPPYRDGEAFARRALGSAGGGVAMLFNTAFLEGVGRSTGLFQEHPPTYVLMCNRRMRLPTGVSSTFSHTWIVWDKEDTDGDTRFRWLHLDRDELTMPTGATPGTTRKGHQ